MSEAGETFSKLTFSILLTFFMGKIPNQGIAQNLCTPAQEISIYHFN